MGDAGVCETSTSAAGLKGGTGANVLSDTCRSSQSSGGPAARKWGFRVTANNQSV